MDFRDCYITYFDSTFVKQFKKLAFINLDTTMTGLDFDCESLPRESSFEVHTPQCSDGESNIFLEIA